MLRIGLEGQVRLDPDFEGSVEFDKWREKVSQEGEKQCEHKQLGESHVLR